MEYEDVQKQFEKYQESVRSKSKINMSSGEVKNSTEEIKQNLINESSTDKREDTNLNENKTNNVSLEVKDDADSSDGNETEFNSDVGKKENEITEEDMEKIQINTSKRLSVSAEAYGEWNKKSEEFVPKVYKKSENEKKKIHEALNESFLFNHLNEQEMETIINAFSDEIVKKDVNIINEGDEGNVLYVIDTGEVEIFKTKDGKKEVLTVLKSKDVFGELALLYNSKRAATAKALNKCHLWTLDRETFTFIIKDNVQKKRQLYEDILKQVTILKDMDPYERSKVADCLKSKKYEKDEIIIKEGETGDTFFMLIDGEAEATKNDQVIKAYKKGDYFGELALLKNKPRAATVKALTSCQVVYLDRKSFKRLLGPIKKILNRNIKNYKAVLKELELDTTCVEDN
ncbi:cAMP-dependent protein kinase regulatory subunit [Hepatocystis sp. ex Piliocolobus tephrosceles]|nr:cAMP-dependent protein kinase regulatory subunit [Hepatocystis sp. ex Piliocolobus tephrosceles]